LIPLVTASEVGIALNDIECSALRQEIALESAMVQGDNPVVSVGQTNIESNCLGVQFKYVLVKINKG
jgi:hypothetical protein